MQHVVRSAIVLQLLARLDGTCERNAESRRGLDEAPQRVGRQGADGCAPNSATQRDRVVRTSRESTPGRHTCAGGSDARLRRGRDRCSGAHPHRRPRRPRDHHRPRRRPCCPWPCAPPRRPPPQSHLRRDPQTRAPRSCRRRPSSPLPPLRSVWPDGRRELSRGNLHRKPVTFAGVAVFSSSVARFGLRFGRSMRAQADG